MVPNRFPIRRVTAAVTLLMLVLAGGSARAEFVTVTGTGDPANPNPGEGQSNGIFGSVYYTYDIGKCEVTNAEYVQFLNAVAASDSYGLYNTSMTSSYGCKITRSGSSGSYTYSVASEAANRPVNFVSYYDAARYCNWATSGNSESGAYQFDGSGNFLGVDRVAGAAVATAGILYTLPTEDEWYKAAYYDPTRSGTDKYWWYPTKHDVSDQPGRDITETRNTGNNANQSTAATGDPTGPIDSPYYMSEVGEFELSSSYYGTFDQGGNVMEWFEGIGWRGGSWVTDYEQMNAEQRHVTEPATEENYELGFRIVALSAESIPEPSTVMLLLVAAMAGLVRRRR